MKHITRTFSPSFCRVADWRSRPGTNHRHAAPDHVRPNGDGSLRPNDIPYLTSASQLQRGLAYNPATGHLLLVDRSTNSSANNDVHILDGNTGAYLRQT